MKKQSIVLILLLLLVACGDMIVTDISIKHVRVIAPAPGMQTDKTDVAFSWEPLTGAEQYRLTVVSPTFEAATRYVVDTLMETVSFAAELADGDYQWRVQAINSEYRNKPQAYSFRVQTERDISDGVIRVIAPGEGMVSGKRDVAFSWEPLAGATQYRVVVVTPSFERAAGFAVDTLLEKTSFSTELTSGAYEWRIQALNSVFTTAAQTYAFRIQTEKDITREIVTVISPQSKAEIVKPEVNFSWNPVDGANHYRLLVASPSFAAMEWLAADRVMEETLFKQELPDGPYEWQVQALNDEFKTVSAIHPFRVRTEKDLSGQKMTVIAPATGSVINQTEVLFSWNAVEGATAYRLQIVSPSFDKMQGLIEDKEVEETVYRVQLGDGEYQWRVYALNAGSQTNPVTTSFRVQTKKDISRDRLTVIAPANGALLSRPEVTFSWESLAGADGYRLMVASPSFAQAQWMADDVTVTGTSHQVTLPAGTYQWRIQAFNDTYRTAAQTYSLRIRDGNDISDRSVTVLAPASGVQLPAGEVVFQWETLAGADRYRVLIAKPGFDQVQQIVHDETTTGTRMTVTLPTGEYQWRIEGLNNNYQSLRQIRSIKIVP